MSEQTLCIFITVLVIALMFAWVPILEFICPPCGRAIERLWRKRSSRTIQQERVSKTNARQA
jgi:cytochrome c oxidase assembly protein Cox11